MGRWGGVERFRFHFRTSETLAGLPSDPNPLTLLILQRDGEQFLKTSFYIPALLRATPKVSPPPTTFFPPLFLNLGFLPQLSGVTNKAECGGTGLCRSGLKARCQIETSREMEADAESRLIAAGCVDAC